MIIASEAAVKEHGLTPRARILGMASAGGAAAHHGHRPGAGDAQADGAARPQNRRLRFDRDQRSLRLAVASVPAAARACRRCRAGQSARRRDRARPSARHVGRAAGADRGARARRARRQARRLPPCASASGRACRWRIERRLHNERRTMDNVADLSERKSRAFFPSICRRATAARSSARRRSR